LNNEATRTPNKANTKQDKNRVNAKTGLTINVGNRISPTTSIATELIKPRTTPINDLPITKEYRLTGEIKNSSKLL